MNGRQVSSVLGWPPTIYHLNGISVQCFVVVVVVVVWIFVSLFVCLFLFNSTEFHFADHAFLLSYQKRIVVKIDQEVPWYIG